MTKPYPQIMAINDLSGVGKCSLTVALPILSCMGNTVAALPTAVLSTHTGGLEGYTYRDLTADMMDVARHWAGLSLHFDAIYSGWLGSSMQEEIVSRIIDMFKEDQPFIFVDPVMGDHGKLYSTYTMDRVEGMRKLCQKANLISPNVTEAYLLLGETYSHAALQAQEAKQLCQRLAGLGARYIVVTGLSTCEGNIGAAAWDALAQSFTLHETPKVPGVWHGTGDIFGSVLLGAVMKGKTLHEAAALATKYIYQCIDATYCRKADSRFGVDFEGLLPSLMEALAYDGKMEGASFAGR